MGRALIESAASQADLVVTAAFEHRASPHLGLDPGALAGVDPLDIEIAGGVERLAPNFDVLIDFTVPEATLENLAYCRAHGKRMIIGTTGMGDSVAAIDAASTDIAIVFAPNMSVGVNLCFKLAEIAAQVLGDEVDIEIIEAHHRHKIDAPSGTAVRLGEIIAAALGRDLAACAVYGREGRTGPRRRETIGFETIRAGEIVGDHTVLYAGAGERIELTHRAQSRATYATGALRAARWVMQQPHGRFDMQHVLGLS